MDHLFINAKDIARISGKSVRTAYRNLSIIKDALEKKPHQQITINEYANYEGIQLSEIITFLADKK